MYEKITNFEKAFWRDVMLLLLLRCGVGIVFGGKHAVKALALLDRVIL